MTDFFTDLNSDILGTKAVPAPPSRHAEHGVRNPRPKIEPTLPVHRPQKSHHQKKNRETNVQNTANTHVIEMRTQMMNAGVVTMVFKVDEKSRTLLGHLKLETRGFALSEEVRELHKMVIKKARASYEDTIKDIPDIEEKDLIKIIRRDMEIFLQNRIERIPVIIPIIIEV